MTDRDEDLVRYQQSLFVGQLPTLHGPLPPSEPSISTTSPMPYGDSMLWLLPGRGNGSIALREGMSLTVGMMDCTLHQVVAGGGLSTPGVVPLGTSTATVLRPVVQSPGTPLPPGTVITTLTVVGVLSNGARVTSTLTITA